METKRLKRIVLQIGVVLLLIVMVFPSAFAATKGTNPAQLKITSVMVTDDLKSLTINGVNFKRAKGSPVVYLGDIKLEISDHSDTSLTAKRFDLSVPPVQIPIPTGDYRLTVTTGKGATEYDAYDLTISAKGGGSGNDRRQIPAMRLRRHKRHKPKTGIRRKQQHIPSM